MILFPDDVKAVNELLKQRAGLDPDLLQACQEHIELEQYADAVFKAFRVLEGRIQQRSGIFGESANKVLGIAFGEKGTLTQKLGLDSTQATNFSSLLRAAFSVFRNPEAHASEALIEYGSAECQAVLGFVNLMLGVLDRQPEDAWQVALKQIRRDIGTEATERLAHFMEHVQVFSLVREELARGFAFKAQALRAPSPSKPPKQILTTVFTVRPGETGEGAPSIVTGGQISDVIGINAMLYEKRMKDIGLTKMGWAFEHVLDLKEHNSDYVFGQMLILIKDIVEDMKRSLENRSATEG